MSSSESFVQFKGHKLSKVDIEIFIGHVFLDGNRICCGIAFVISPEAQKYIGRLVAMLQPFDKKQGILAILQCH